MFDRFERGNMNFKRLCFVGAFAGVIALGISVIWAHTKAEALYASGQFDSALPIFAKFAALGDSRAMNRFGMMLLNGQGTPKDKEAAMMWLERAANRGVADAQVTMGDMANNGNEESKRIALAWYLKAANQGHADAQFKTYLLYGGVQAIPQLANDKEALFWLEKAADQEHVGALDHLGIANNSGFIGLNEDIVKAYKYFTLMYITLASKDGDTLGNNSEYQVSTRSVAEISNFLSRMTREDVIKGNQLVREWVKNHPKHGALSDLDEKSMLALEQRINRQDCINQVNLTAGFIKSPIPNISISDGRSNHTAQKQEDGGTPIVALDVGHTTNIPGAKSFGNNEFNLNKKFTKALEVNLTKRRLAVIETNPDGRAERPVARIKKIAGSNLLVSIHHNSLAPDLLQMRTGDFEPPKDFDQNYTPGYSLFVSRDNRKLSKSLSCAATIDASLRRAKFLPSLNSVQSLPGDTWFSGESVVTCPPNDLAVLYSASVPAILISVGEMTSLSELLTMANAKRQARMANAIARGIEACLSAP
jgi:N-acetylmuramoyl-L-alanine amidase